MPGFGEVPRGDSLIAQIRAERLGEYTFCLYPELWTTPRIVEYYHGRTWTETRFIDPPPIDIPTQSGIYMFVVAPRCANLQDHSYIFYVGQTKNLKRRYREYLQAQQGKGSSPREKVVMFLHNFRDYVYFHFTLVPESELNEAESLLNNSLTPPANTRLEIRGRLTPISKSL